jgi:hypothetical protein
MRSKNDLAVAGLKWAASKFLSPFIRFVSLAYCTGTDSGLANGNQKRQPEAAIETATRSGKKQEIEKKIHGGGD